MIPTRKRDRYLLLLTTPTLVIITRWTDIQVFADHANSSRQVVTALIVPQNRWISSKISWHSCSAKKTVYSYILLLYYIYYQTRQHINIKHRKNKKNIHWKTLKNTTNIHRFIGYLSLIVPLQNTKLIKSSINLSLLNTDPIKIT